MPESRNHRNAIRLRPQGCVHSGYAGTRAQGPDEGKMLETGPVMCELCMLCNMARSHVKVLDAASTQGVPSFALKLQEVRGGGLRAVSTSTGSAVGLKILALEHAIQPEL